MTCLWDTFYFTLHCIVIVAERNKLRKSLIWGVISPGSQHQVRGPCSAPGGEAADGLLPVSLTSPCRSATTAHCVVFLISATVLLILERAPQSPWKLVEASYITRQGAADSDAWSSSAWALNACPGDSSDAIGPWTSLLSCSEKFSYQP